MEIVIVLLVGVRRPFVNVTVASKRPNYVNRVCIHAIIYLGGTGGNTNIDYI